MSLVDVKVTRKFTLTGSASVIVTVPIKIDGTFTSPEERAKQFVAAAAAAGQHVEWDISYDQEDKRLITAYDLTAENLPVPVAEESV